MVVPWAPATSSPPFGPPHPLTPHPQGPDDPKACGHWAVADAAVQLLLPPVAKCVYYSFADTLEPDGGHSGGLQPSLLARGPAVAFIDVPDGGRAAVLGPEAAAFAARGALACGGHCVVHMQVMLPVCPLQGSGYPE